MGLAGKHYRPLPTVCSCMWDKKRASKPCIVFSSQLSLWGFLFLHTHKFFTVVTVVECAGIFPYYTVTWSFFFLFFFG